MKFSITALPTNKLAILCTAVCAAMLAFTHNASANTVLTIGDSQTLGEVLYGIPSGDNDRLTYVNTLISLAPGTVGYPADGQTYNRYKTNPGPGYPNYPTATFRMDGTGNTGINLGNGTMFTYLFAKYDGPNAGSIVWYVGNLSGLIDIPATWLGYGLSGWTLFGPGQGAPDGGTTVMLLGAALGALGIARRFLKR